MLFKRSKPKLCPILNNKNILVIPMSLFCTENLFFFDQDIQLPIIDSNWDNLDNIPLIGFPRVYDAKPWTEIKKDYFQVGDLRMLYYWDKVYSRDYNNCNAEDRDGLRWAEEIIFAMPSLVHTSSYNPEYRFKVTPKLLFHFWFERWPDATEDDVLILNHIAHALCSFSDEMKDYRPNGFIDCNEFYSYYLWKRGTEFDMVDGDDFLLFERVGSNRKVCFQLPKKWCYENEQCNVITELDIFN